MDSRRELIARANKLNDLQRSLLLDWLLVFLQDGKPIEEEIERGLVASQKVTVDV